MQVLLIYLASPILYFITGGCTTKPHHEITDMKKYTPTPESVPVFRFASIGYRKRGENELQSLILLILLTL